MFVYASKTFKLAHPLCIHCCTSKLKPPHIQPHSIHVLLSNTCFKTMLMALCISFRLIYPEGPFLGLVFQDKFIAFVSNLSNCCKTSSDDSYRHRLWFTKVFWESDQSKQCRPGLDDRTLRLISFNTFCYSFNSFRHTNM